MAQAGSPNPRNDRSPVRSVRTGRVTLLPRQHATEVGLRTRSVLVLRFGLEIAGVMALVQLFFRRPAGAVDHSPALDGRALTDFFCPACQVFILVRLQERARVVVG